MDRGVVANCVLKGVNEVFFKAFGCFFQFFRDFQVIQVHKQWNIVDMARLAWAWIVTQFIHGQTPGCDLNNTVSIPSHFYSGSILSSTRSKLIVEQAENFESKHTIANMAAKKVQYESHSEFCAFKANFLAQKHDFGHFS